MTGGRSSIAEAAEIDRRARRTGCPAFAEHDGLLAALPGSTSDAPLNYRSAVLIKICPANCDICLRRGHSCTYPASSPVKAASQVPRKMNRFHGATP